MRPTLSGLLNRRLVLALVAAAVIIAVVGFGIVLPTLQVQATIPAEDNITTPTDTTPSTTEPKTAPTTTTDTTTPPENSTFESALGITIPVQPQISDSTGDVETVEGSINGTFTWTGSEEASVEFVARSWIPGMGWEPVDQATVSLDNEEGTIDMNTVFDDQITFADGGRADALSNPEDGTAVVHRGTIQVTATVEDGDSTITRETANDSYEITVRNEWDTLLSGDSTSSSESRPALELDGTGPNPTLFQANNIAPGRTGQGSVTVRNVGDADGSIGIRFNVFGAENGLTEVEKEAGDTISGPNDEGELVKGLYVRAALIRSDGSTEYLVGNEESYSALDRIDENSVYGGPTVPSGANGTLVVEWKLASWVGNEAQGDGAAMDMDIVLRSGDNSGSLGFANLADSLLEPVTDLSVGSIAFDQSVSGLDPHGTVAAGLSIGYTNKHNSGGKAG